MNGDERRTEILKIISDSDVPVSGSALAKQLHVSRQVIVQDIALLKTAKHTILSTYKGYLLDKPDHVTRIFKVSHTDEQISDELGSIVEAGGIILDVFIHHKVYGEIRVPLNIRTLRDVDDFASKIKSGKSTPLKNITSNFHYHTIEADTINTLDAIENLLSEKGYLIIPE